MVEEAFRKYFDIYIYYGLWYFLGFGEALERVSKDGHKKQSLL